MLASHGRIVAEFAGKRTAASCPHIVDRRERGLWKLSPIYGVLFETIVFDLAYSAYEGTIRPSEGQVRHVGQVSAVDQRVHEACQRRFSLRAFNVDVGSDGSEGEVLD